MDAGHAEVYTLTFETKTQLRSIANIITKKWEFPRELESNKCIFSSSIFSCSILTSPLSPRGKVDNKKPHTYSSASVEVKLKDQLIRSIFGGLARKYLLIVQYSAQ
jgi:hypothetical protein